MTSTEKKRRAFSSSNRSISAAAMPRFVKYKDNNSSKSTASPLTVTIVPPTSPTLSGTPCKKFTNSSSSPSGVIPDLKSPYAKNGSSLFLWGIGTIDETNFVMAVTFVDSCIDWLRRKKAHLMEGIFRHSGNETRLVQLQNAIHDYLQSGDMEKAFEFGEVEDPYTIATLLKRFFRGMSYPLLTFNLYSVFISANKNNQTEDSRLEKLKEALLSLPEYNKIILKKLCHYLYEVSLYESENLMSSKNLSIVVAPNILWPSKRTAMSEISDAPSITGIVQAFISKYDFFFESELPVDDFQQSVVGKTDVNYKLNETIMLEVFDEKLTHNRLSETYNNNEHIHTNLNIIDETPLHNDDKDLENVSENSENISKNLERDFQIIFETKETTSTVTITTTATTEKLVESVAPSEKIGIVESPPDSNKKMKKRVSEKLLTRRKSFGNLFHHIGEKQPIDKLNQSDNTTTIIANVLADDSLPLKRNGEKSPKKASRLRKKNSAITNVGNAHKQQQQQQQTNSGTTELTEFSNESNSVGSLPDKEPLKRKGSIRSRSFSSPNIKTKISQQDPSSSPKTKQPDKSNSNNNSNSNIKATKWVDFLKKKSEMENEIDSPAAPPSPLLLVPVTAACNPQTTSSPKRSRLLRNKSTSVVIPNTSPSFVVSDESTVQLKRTPSDKKSLKRTSSNQSRQKFPKVQNDIENPSKQKSPKVLNDPIIEISNIQRKDDLSISINEVESGQKSSQRLSKTTRNKKV